MTEQMESPAQIPEEAVQAVVAAIKELEEAKDIPEEMLVELAANAISQDLLHDKEWLINELSSIKTQILLNPEANKENKILEIQIEDIPQISSQEELDEVVKKHQIWMESVINPRRAIASGRAVLRGCNLSGLSLKNANLSCADFSGAQMVGCTLTGGNFSRAKFLDTNLQGADMRNAKFKSTDFKGADLRDCDTEGAEFLQAKLEDTALESQIDTNPIEPPEVQL